MSEKQPILYHCSCGASLHPYVIAGALYHEYIVALDTEANFVRHFAPPTPETTEGLNEETRRDWWELYQGDLIYAASFAWAEAWMGRGQPMRQPPHDIYNPDGTRRYTAPPHGAATA